MEQLPTRIASIGLVGLSGQGAAFAIEQRQRGYTVLCFDFDNNARQQSANAGFVTTSSMAGVVLHLSLPRMVWVMEPDFSRLQYAVTRLSELLDPGDTVVLAGPVALGDGPKKLFSHQMKSSSLQLFYVEKQKEKTWLLGEQPAFDLLRHFFGITLPDAIFTAFG